MYAPALFTILISIFVNIINCLYLEAESNFLRPKLERNNIVNKGVWVRSKKKRDDDLEKGRVGFIFRQNSMDVDNTLPNNYDAFVGNSAMRETPYVSNYIQRSRRSPDHIRKRRPRKSMKSENVIKNSVEDAVILKSKIVTDLKPASVLNEYPNQVAILLNVEQNNNRNITLNKKHIVKELASNHKNKTDVIQENEITVIPIKINSVNPDRIPKRSKKNNVEDRNNYQVVDESNNTDYFDTSKQNRNIFDKDERIWNQNAPLPDTNVYKVIPKEPERHKGITEAGLIKVIAMLTKTFKKITKQHTDIKNIHNKLSNVDTELDSKIAALTNKFEDFDSKYSDMLQFNNKIKTIEAQLIPQKEYFDTKQKEVQNTFIEFQSQQKKFLAQQRQFYTIQKLMLSQNEKINAKQNVIAKTQNEISHRQNGFARLLKKAKQIIYESKTKENFTYVQPIETDNNSEEPRIAVTTPALPTKHSNTALNTQAMKINLLSIQTKSKLEDQDALIIREKDDKHIDDLVYKYYFNNTFIDNLMKSKILNNYATDTNSVELVHRHNQSKKKRNKLESTLMIPVNNSISELSYKRDRRWINHYNNKYRKSNRHKKGNTLAIKFKGANKIKDDSKEKEVAHKQDSVKQVNQIESKMINDPFLTMAFNFCNEIGQNNGEQELNWCVEKSLRRLKFMESNSMTPPPVTVMQARRMVLQEVTKPSTLDNRIYTREEMPTFSALTPSVASPQPVASITTLLPAVTSIQAVSTKQTTPIYFPDNDELESNLKAYDLKPDPEGNVYYEGSVHISDYGRLMGVDSGGTSDVMPGLLDSDSRVDMDPMVFKLQASRKSYVRRLNANILKQMRTPMPR